MKKAKAAEERESRRDTRLRFEQWARNPACQANTLSAVHGISMAEVAKSEGLTPTMGQSPFALARGQSFERGLFKNGAKLLRDALEEQEVLPEGSAGFADIRLRMNGGTLRDLDTAVRNSTALFEQLARVTGPPVSPSIIASAAILIPARVMLPEAMLVIDALIARWDAQAKRVELMVGEIKTYPDRGGHTDGGELAAARAQAGVYVHGLDVTLARLGLAERLGVSRNGFLVLSRPGSNWPSVRVSESLKYQAMRAERGFVQLEEAARELPTPGESARVAAVREAETTYDSACISFCDRAEGCFQRACDAGNPSILGADVARFLGDIDLHRAEQLLSGRRPSNEAEQAFVASLRQ